MILRSFDFFGNWVCLLKQKTEDRRQDAECEAYCELGIAYSVQRIALGWMGGLGGPGEIGMRHVTG